MQLIFGNNIKIRGRLISAIRILIYSLFVFSLANAESLPPDEYFFQTHEPGSQINYNDLKLNEALNNVLYFLEGSLGAGLMLAFGVAAILSSAFGQFRAAIGLLIVAVGAFLIRAYISMFLGSLGIV
jgi:hypothetical protein